MPALSAADRASIRDLQVALTVFSDREPSTLPIILPRLRALIGAQKMATFSLNADAQGVSVGFAHAVGWKGQRFAEELTRFMRGRNDSGGPFNARSPEPKQRNRTFAIRQLRRATCAALDHAARQQLLPRLQVADADQLRALVCDGPSLLAWVGGFRSGEFFERERQLLNRLIPALRRRLRLERQLQDAGLAAAALEASMAALGVPAFVATAGGQIRHANPSGVVARDHQGSALTDALATAIRAPRANPRFSVTPIAVGQRADHYLVLEHVGDAAARVGRARERWQLTPRQVQVLELLAQGDPNKTIADKLACTVRTVEVHVSALLDKAGVDGRSRLIAKLISER